MKLLLLTAGAATLLILFFSCTLPTTTAPLASTSVGSGSSVGSTSGGTAPSLSVATSGNQGVLVTPNGRLDIAAVGSDGVKVSCAVPYGVSRFGGDGTNDSAVILGKTSTGAPGIWIYDKGKIEAPWNEDTGMSSSLLGDSGEHNGMLKGRFGWTYTRAGWAKGTDSRIIVGVAENTKGFTFGKYTIAPGTTVGVYWMIWKARHDRHFVVSNARIIGVLATSDSHQHNWWGHDVFDRFMQRFDMLKAFFTGTLTSYLTGVDKDGVSFDTTSSNYIVSGSDENNAAADATINQNGQVLSIASKPSQQSTVDLTVGKITPSAYTVAQSSSGSSLDVSFSVENLGNSAVTSSFDVNLYYSTSSTFSPSASTPIGTATVPTIGAQGTVAESSIPVTIPSLTTNENVYIYADVAAPSGTTDSNPSNNISSLSQAAVVLVYNVTSGYSLIVETYGTTGGSSNPGISLFKLTTSTSGTPELSHVQNASAISQGSNTYNSLDFTSGALGTLSSGTYYLAVFPLMGSGAYALNVRSPNVTSPTFTALTADPTNVTNIVSSSSSTMVVGGSDYNSYTTPVPTIAEPINVGNAQNWYLNGSDLGGTDATEWFTFTLP